MNLTSYLSQYRNKRVAVAGLGVSNRPLIRLLSQAGASILACDKKDRAALGDFAQELDRLGAELCLGEGYLDRLQGCDVIFRSPGIRPDLPQFQAAIAARAVLTSEMEAFFEVCPCPILAVTGSDGKTTTTTLISELLKAQGHTVHLGGNIGRPLLADAEQMTPADYAVLELSSFQLMTLRRAPHVAVVTNLAPNHLDIHRDMEEYIDAKKNIFRAQGPLDRLILNADNPITAAFAGEASGQVCRFSRKSEPVPGVFVRGEEILSTLGGTEQSVLRKSQILLPGEHNVENYMAAIAATWGLCAPETVQRVAETFPGVPHRIEFVREKDGVRYYNSSIDSSPTRTAACLRSFPGKSIVICGGYDKHIPFAPLGEVLVEKAKAVVLTGATAGAIQAALEATPGFRAAALPVCRESDFRQAVLAARDLASPGDVVVLSPACASFDAFPNFAVRGDTFRGIVRAL